MVLVDGQWYSPEAVLRGPPIFGRFRTFAPNIEGLEPLWDALQIAEPTLDDCIDVLRRLAFRKLSHEHEGVMVSTLRAMADKLDGAPLNALRTLRRLPLWTGTGWSAKRPAYFMEGPVAAAATDDMVVWKPGLSSAVDLDRLLPALEVIRLRLEDFSPRSIDAASVVNGEANRAQFVATLALLRNELVRGDPQLNDSLETTWEQLLQARFVIEPELEISHQLADGTMLTAPARAHMSREPLMFVSRSLSDAAETENGGEAIASLFSGDRQKIKWAWGAFWAQAEKGERAETIELPSMKPQAAADNSDRLVSLQNEARRRNSKLKPVASRGPSVGAPPIVQVRKLRNLEELRPDEGTIINARANKRGIVFANAPKSDAGGRIFHRMTAEPGARPERGVLPSGNDREDLALDTVRHALRLNPQQICDLRARRGLGVDAIDELRQCYEIKMFSSAAIPKDVTLTASEVDAAQNDPDFFLALVTGLEEGEGELRVRFIFDPLHALSVKVRRDLTLTGVDDAEALEYRFLRAELLTP
jgi:hypothetical protein